MVRKRYTPEPITSPPALKWHKALGVVVNVSYKVLLVIETDILPYPGYVTRTRESPYVSVSTCNRDFVVRSFLAKEYSISVKTEELKADRVPHHVHNICSKILHVTRTSSSLIQRP
jgi:hypothetical protein